MPQDAANSHLTHKTVRLAGQRTSLRLEPEIWAALNDIASAEGVRVAEVISRLHHSGTTRRLASAVRCFVIAYYRQKACPA